MRIETSGDQHELGLERLCGGEHDVLEQRQPQLLFATGRHGEIDRVALSKAGADVAQQASPRVDPCLVDAREQHIGATAERLGGAVAVVNVPIKDEYPLDTELCD